MEARPVSVHHEWGTLKEVIVGIGDDLTMPGYCEAVSFFYDPEQVELMKTYGGIPELELNPEYAREARKQIDNLASVLQERGVVVHRSRRLSAEEMKYLDYVQKGSHFFYARDPVIVIGDHVIEGAMSVPFKVKERYAIRPVLRERLRGSNARYVSMPAPSPAFGRDQMYLEGGDVLLNGEEIYVGISGKGSSPEGVEWLQNYLGPTYRVHQVRVSPEFEHLDCVLALARPGLGVRCREAFIDDLPESIRDWDYVEVTKGEAKKLGANLMVLDDRTVIIDAQHHRIGRELEKRGVEVMEIPYGQVASSGGGLRCSHHPLVRESAL
jgi:N-dimethylarginine dimethylaminohydrolase